MTMTHLPFDPQDRKWLFLRLFALGLVVAVHPLPFDLRRWGLVVPPFSAHIAYVVFECLQTAVFAAALFFGDMLPGMRFATEHWRRLVSETQGAPIRTKLSKFIPFLLGAPLVVWLILTPAEYIVNAAPPGTPRFCAATAYFIIERFVAILVFVIIVNANDGDDDEPGARRRSIAGAVAELLHLGRVRTPAGVPVTTS